MFLSLLALQILAASPNTDPFGFLQPSVTVSADERRQLGRGQPIVRVLPTTELEIAVFAAVPVDVDGDRLVAWIRRIEVFKKGEYVPAIARFSDPPRIEDLNGLALDDDELSAILTCRPGHCDLKLTAVEMNGLQRAAAAAGGDWRATLQQAFRTVVLERVTAYLAEGHGALAPYVDHENPLLPATQFASVLGHSEFVNTHLLPFAQHLGAYPHTPLPTVESFVYWSKERLARKDVITATHVSILRSSEAGLPDALVASKSIFATHYVNASLGITALVRGKPGEHNYVAYVNRSDVDKVGGMFSGLVRWVVRRRLKAEAAKVLHDIRRRLEGGGPPLSGR